MPLYRFICETCSLRVNKLMELGEQKKLHLCDCGGILTRNSNPPGTMMVETLDNGAMPRKLERLQNAEQLYRDRAAADPRKKRV